MVGGLSSAGIGGNGSGSVTLTGTVAQINATLAASNGLTYLEQGDHSSDTLTVATQDQGTAFTATNTVAINVTEINDASNTVPTTPVNATEGVGTAISGIAISDPDASGNVTTTLSVLNGTLTVANNVVGGLSSADIGGNGSGSVTLTGTVAQINATLAASNGLTYLEQGDHSSDTLTVATQDQGTAFTATNTVAINVTETNDASNTVPTTPVSATEGVGTAISGIAISDPDASGNVTTTLSVLNGTLTVANNVVGGLSSAGIGGNGSGSVTLTGTVAQINATLAASNGLTYLEQGDHSSDTLTVATQDQGTALLLTATNTVAINVTEINDASNTVPTVPVSATEGVGTAIGGMAISDPDASGNVTTTLSVLNGTLTVANNVVGGLSGAGIGGNGSGSVTLTGTVAQINATLAASNGLTYLEQGDHTSDTLTVATQDQGTAFTATNTVAINVTAINDASNTVPTTPVSATEGVGMAISGIAISDPDASGNVTTTLSVLNGTLTVASNVVGGLSSAGIGGNGSGSVTLTGTVAQINATLAASNGLTYLEQGDHSSDTLTVATQDQGTAFTATNTVAINVTETNDASNIGADHAGECDRGRRHGDQRHRDQRSGRQRQHHYDAVGAQWHADGGEQCGGRAEQRRHRRQWQRLGHPDRHGGADQCDAGRPATA